MLLLRHASAGERLSSPLLDRERRLDLQGRADATRLPEVLAGHVVERVVTSPHVRCVETVHLLAAAKGLTLELRDELMPDAPGERTLALLAELSATTVVCTHREVIERLFDGEVECEKGGAWLIEALEGRWVPTAYVPPASSARRERSHAVSV